MTQGFTSALVRAHETPARITYTDAQVSERVGIDISALIAQNSGEEQVDFAAEYMRDAAAAQLNIEHDLCAGERVLDFEPRCDNPKFKFAFLTVLGGMKKSRALAVCWPDKIFPALASGRTRNPTTVIQPNCNEAIETIYGEHKKLVRAATPKLQRAVINAAGITEETTSAEWRLANGGKLTGRDKAAIDMAKFLVDKLYINSLTNEKTFAGKEDDTDPLAESAARLGMESGDKDEELPAL